ncbi:Teichoic acid ribitol-phosphate polymerase TarK [Streptococcus infantarius subsp. infantarius]|nr:Teichoic acid ribitol-phosphate polymerase TarK [Streptococcus infantarius subsp. infantarius]
MKNIYLLVGLIKLFIARCISFFYGKNDNVWLICEKTDEARDNGYHFFKYCILNEKRDDVYYIITKKSYDLEKISFGKENVIYTNSFKHCIYYFRAKKLITSQALPFPYSERLCKFFFKVGNQKYFWLQHGITKDKLNHKDMDYEYKEYELVCCASDREAKFFVDEFGYNENQAISTGFCRFDSLIDTSSSSDYILVMPTFRKWLTTSDIVSEPTKMEEDVFLKSDFFKNYSSLFKSEEFSRFLERNNLKVIFYLHYAFQSYSYLFNKIKNERVIIAKKGEYDVQKLLRDSKILITDYSSIFFDFAYMNKPELFFQFDKNQYRNQHYGEGYFSYENDAFGPVFSKVDEIIDYLTFLSKRNYLIETKYQNRVDKFFSYRDCKNCERIYKEISRK